MNESSVFLLLPGLVLGRLREAILTLRSQENIVLDVHTPGLQLQAAARPLSCPSNPPTEEPGIGWAGVRQAANLASARTLPPDRSFPTFHSLVTRHGRETQHPHSKGATELSTARELERGWRNVKGRPHLSNRPSPEPRNPGETYHVLPPRQNRCPLNRMPIK